MLSPISNSLGTIALDFFQHGAVAYGGAQNKFGVIELCLTSGFGINSIVTSGFDYEVDLLAGMGINSTVTSGFNIVQNLASSIPDCD